MSETTEGTRVIAATVSALPGSARERFADRVAARRKVDGDESGGRAAARGLRVTLVEKHDLAFGTSRWSSKLVHGGLRYLATGNVGIARRSAVERGILMTRNAPHLVRAMPQLVPLLPSMSRTNRRRFRSGGRLLQTKPHSRRSHRPIG